MVELFLSAFITLFVIIDPPGCAPIYAGLTTGASAAQRRSMAIRACAIAFAILLFFLLLGEPLLAALHIELDSFRIAGGLMLFLIALDMVFEKRTQRREKRAEQVMATPGAIASVMLLESGASGTEGSLVVIAALAGVMLLTLLALLAAAPLMRIFGAGVEAVITRLLGVLLGALAAQYVIDGLRGSFGV